MLVSFGEDVGIGTTLQEALDDVLGTKSSDGATSGDQGGDQGGSGGTAIPGNVRSLLLQAEQKFSQAQKALRAGDLQGYANAQKEARALVQQALDAADKAAAQSKKKPSSSPSSKSSSKPSSSPSSKSSASPSSG